MRPRAAGKTVCYMHGGAPGSGGNPQGITKSGRYSRALRQAPKLADWYEAMASDPNLTDLAHEVALMRSYLSSYLDKHSESLDGVEAGRHLGEISEQIGRLVERKHRIEHGEQFTLTVPQLVSYAGAIAEIINARVSDEQQRLVIAQDLDRLFGQDLRRLPLPSVEGEFTVMEGPVGMP